MKLVIALAALLTFPISAFSANQTAWDRATQFYGSGHYSEALSELDKISGQSSSNTSVHYLQGLCYKALGKTNQAQKELSWVANYASDAKTKEMAQAALRQMSNPAGSSAGAPFRSASGSARGQGAFPPPPRTLINDSVSETIRVAAQSGWVPCPGNCLNVNTPGWHHEHIDGHADTEMWHTFGLNGGHHSATTAHWGQVFEEKTDAPVVNKGNCPVCGGTGWVRAR